MKTVTTLLIALLSLQCASTQNRGNSDTDLPAFAKNYKTLVKRVVNANNLYYFNQIAFEVKVDDCKASRKCIRDAYVKWQQEYMKLVPMLKAAKKAKRIMVENCTDPAHLKICTAMANFNHAMGDIERLTNINLSRGSHYTNLMKLILNEAGNQQL